MKKQKKITWILLGVAVSVLVLYSGFRLGLSVKIPQSKVTNDGGEIHRFNCPDGKYIIAVFYPNDDTKVNLSLSDDRDISLKHVISASGARYANDDESMVFWNKGNSAFITEGDKTTFDGCVTNN